jgi:EAL domain-containing protein (putative c-di-GMP-specific phosphodiesterase class I)
VPGGPGRPITRTWVAASALAAATWIGSMGADVVGNVVQHDEIPTPFSGNAVDSHAAAVFVGLVSVPLLQRRRRAVLEAARLQDAEESLEEYRAKDRATAGELAALRRRVRGCIAADGITMFVQPIYSIAEAPALVGYEALARFADGRPPDAWFGEARDAGLDAELELVAVRLALELLPDIPEPCYLSVNVSPAVLVSEQFFTLLRGHDAGRCVVEVTEHLHVQSYDDLRLAIERLRRLGLRLAVDDAGAGFASFRHILQLGPDIIKLDRDLIRRCNVDFVRRTLAASLVSFAQQIGASLVAEGVETEQELVTLRSMGVLYGQGYHLGRPAPLRRPAPSDAQATS